MQSTIAAISTGLTESGISVIRVSGDEAFSIVDKCFLSKSLEKALLKYSPNTVHLGFIADNNDEIIDEALVTVFKSPRSYTGEDTVEISCHGGILVTKRILDTVLKNGAVLSEPGEFTKRAFLNGKLDLSEAEAVMDVISSKNDLALSASVKNLNGALSKRVRAIRQKILDELSFIEAALDDPEHMSLDGYRDDLSDKLDGLISELKALISSADNGKIVKDGISTVILGKPNAGKSSLLNILLGENRAIVTDIEGTTRDTLEENINISGISLNIADTAGIRESDNPIEKLGVERAMEHAKNADLIIYVVDASKRISDTEKIIDIVKRKKTIVLLNKSDLSTVVSEADIYKAFGIDNNITSGFRIIKTSTKDISENFGLEEFEAVLNDMFFGGIIGHNDEIMITNMRHKEALSSALSSLKLVKKSIDDNMEEDFFSIDLMAAYAELGKIIGEAVEEDLVEQIFSKFCMGK